MHPSVRPLGKNVLVKLRPKAEKVGSIFIPQGSYLQAEDLADVIAVGSGFPTKTGGRHPHSVQPGDVVLVNRIMEKTKQQEGVQHVLGDGYLILQGDKDILGIIEEKE